MKWFKHDSNANMDSKLKRVMLKYGMEGYGLYWYCLELIAQSVESHNLTFELEHDAELIAASTQIHYERVQEMMVDFVKWGLFEQNGLLITCLKMAVRTDEYTQKLMRNLPNLPTTSRQSPDKVPPKRREQKRIEQNRTEQKRERGFAPPTSEVVREYCVSRHYDIDAEQFVNFYESKGWMIGKNKMKSWKAAVATWVKRDSKKEGVSNNEPKESHAKRFSNLMEQVARAAIDEEDPY